MKRAVDTSSTSLPGGVAIPGALVSGTLGRLLATHQQHLVDPLGGDHSRRPVQGLLKMQAQRHERMVIPPHRPLAVMRQPPHAQIEQPRGTRCHAVDSAALEFQMMYCEYRR